MARTVRILVAKLSGDGSDRDAQLVARTLADAGNEVVYAGHAQSPEMIAAAAIQESVDTIGLSTTDPSTVTAVRDALAARGASDIDVTLYAPEPA